MKKHFLKSFALIAMLFSTLTMSAATKYCGDQVQSTVDNQSVSIGVTILKVGDVLRVSFESEHISGIRAGGTFQQWGNGVWANQADAVANFKDGWTQNGTIWTKDFAFSTYPTSGTGQIYCLFDIVNAGAPPVAGFTLTDIDLFATCDETPGEGGEEPEPEPETPSVVYCDFPTGHNGDANFGDANGRILVSVVKKSETAVRLVVKSADAATKNLDLLYVEAAGANPHATTVGSDVAESDLREMSVDITYPTAPAKYSFMIQWSHPDWGGRWQTNLNDITVEQLCTEGGETPGEGGETGDLIVTEYCYYTNELLTKNGAAIALTWETAENGDVVITMDNGIGAESCSYRNGGFEGGIEAFVVSTDNFVTTTPASDYFTFEKVFSGNEARLVNKADLEKGAKIMHIGSGHALAWTVNGNNEYCFPDFIYTYGGVCNKLEAPTDVVATLKSASYTSVVITCQAADNSGTVSFDIFDGETKLATSGAESGKPVDVTVAGLEAGKTYNLSVVAYDINENKAAAVSVEATTLALPVAAPAPTHAAENVYSIYSNAYTSPTYFWIGGWGQATVATEVNLAAEDKAYLLQNTNYLGWEINNNQPFDVSAYNKFHIDIYALAEGTLQITPISAGPKENLQTLTLKEGWNQTDMDCATFEGVEFDKVIQIKFAEGGNATYFIDNVYFYKPAVGSAVENTQVEVQSHKLIRNGVLYIIRNGVTYDVMGRVVR